MHHLFSAVQFFQVLLLSIGGLFFLALPSAPSLRVAISNLFLFNEAVFLYVGAIFLSIGIILGIGFYFLQRHRALQVTMNPSVSVDGKVVADLVNLYLQKRFPDQTFKTEAVVSSDGLLEIISDMPVIPHSQMKKHLQQMEQEVGQLLKTALHYQKKFTLTFKS